MYMIHKQILPMPNRNGDVLIDVPAGSRYLNAGMQHGDIVVWYLVDTENYELLNTTEPLYLKVINTGPSFDMSPEYQYSTTLTSSNGIVWHIFAKGVQMSMNLSWNMESDKLVAKVKNTDGEFVIKYDNEDDTGKPYDVCFYRDGQYATDCGLGGYRATLKEAMGAAERFLEFMTLEGWF